MRVSCVSIIALAATAATSSAQASVNYEVDTNRAPRFFDQPQPRKAGYTYADELGLGVKAEMETSGMNVKMSFDAMGDWEMKVEERPNHDGTKIELTVKNVKSDLNSFIMNLHCDSNDRGKSDPDCEELFTIVGEKETVEADAAGEIVSITTFDGETMDMAQMTEAADAMTLNDKFSANQFAASTHLDKTSQMLKLIPDHAVRPGDSWIDDVEMGNLGTFKGTSYLQGYTTYKDSDCAIFYFEGSLHLDISKIAQAIGADPSTLPSNMADAAITNVIFWDPEEEIARFAEANVTTSFDIANPMDPNDTNPMHIPVDLTVSLATDVIACPEHMDDPEGHASYVSSPASTNSSGSSGGGGGGGYFGGIFFVVVVGVAAAGGLFLYKKRQEDMNAYARPIYEFAPVSEEPITIQSPMV